MGHLEASLTKDQLESALKELEKEVILLHHLHNEVSQMQDRLETLQSGTVQVSLADKTRIDKEHEIMQTHWKQRKKMFKGVWDTITESLPGSAADFMQELGIETDG